MSLHASSRLLQGIVFCLLSAGLLLARADEAKKASVPLLAMAGDSTMASYNPEKTPTRGWGQFFEEEFAPGTVRVQNFAISGRSTKTFIERGDWEKLLASHPDYVFIQFGHNDSHAVEKPESTDFATDYKANLVRFIKDVRAQGGKPILVTPMVRRTFEPEGKKIRESASGGRTLSRFAASVREVAAEHNVPLIDLYVSSLIWAERLGFEKSQEYASTEGDRTHFNDAGARAMGALVSTELPQVVPELGKLLQKKN